MKTIDFKSTEELSIHYNRIKPAINTCPVTGVKEFYNVEVDYTPTDKVLDIVDFRRYFEKETNLLIEEIAQKVFDEINSSCNPKKLKVQIFLEGNPNLTDWSVTIEK